MSEPRIWIPAFERMEDGEAREEYYARESMGPTMGNEYEEEAGEVVTGEKG